MAGRRSASATEVLAGIPVLASTSVWDLPDTGLHDTLASLPEEIGCTAVGRSACGGGRTKRDSMMSIPEDLAHSSATHSGRRRDILQGALLASLPESIHCSDTCAQSAIPEICTYGDSAPSRLKDRLIAKDITAGGSSFADCTMLSQQSKKNGSGVCDDSGAFGEMPESVLCAFQRPSRARFVGRPEGAGESDRALQRAQPSPLDPSSEELAAFVGGEALERTVPRAEPATSSRTRRSNVKCTEQAHCCETPSATSSTGLARAASAGHVDADAVDTSSVCADPGDPKASVRTQESDPPTTPCAARSTDPNVEPRAGALGFERPPVATGIKLSDDSIVLPLVGALGLDGPPSTARATRPTDPNGPPLSPDSPSAAHSVAESGGFGESRFDGSQACAGAPLEDSAAQDAGRAGGARLATPLRDSRGPSTHPKAGDLGLAGSCDAGGGRIAAAAPDASRNFALLDVYSSRPIVQSTFPQEVPGSLASPSQLRPPSSGGVHPVVLRFDGASRRRSASAAALLGRGTEACGADGKAVDSGEQRRRAACRARTPGAGERLSRPPGRARTPGGGERHERGQRTPGARERTLSPAKLGGQGARRAQPPTRSPMLQGVGKFVLGKELIDMDAR